MEMGLNRHSFLEPRHDFFQRTFPTPHCISVFLFCSLGFGSVSMLSSAPSDPSLDALRSFPGIIQQQKLGPTGFLNRVQRRESNGENGPPPRPGLCVISAARRIRRKPRAPARLPLRLRLAGLWLGPACAARRCSAYSNPRPCGSPLDLGDDLESDPAASTSQIRDDQAATFFVRGVRHTVKD